MPNHARSQRNGAPGTRLLPAVELLSSVVFPNDVVSIQLQEDSTLVPWLSDDAQDLTVATVYARAGERHPDLVEHFEPVCVVCRVVQHMRMPGGGLQAVFQGLERARIEEYWTREGRAQARVSPLPPEVEDDADGSATARVGRMLDELADHLARDNTYPDDLESILRLNHDGPGRFADLVAAYLHLPLKRKRAVVTTVDPHARLDVLREALEEEFQRGRADEDVNRRMREIVEDRQREQYLRQQLKAIRAELGDAGAGEDECERLAEELAGLKLPAEARATAEREIARLRSISPSSAEYQVVRTYVGWLLELPWRRRTRDRLDPARARAILDEDHTGLDDVKERITELIAVRKLTRSRRGPVLCLVGPPGTGKTSLGRSIARALGRKFVRMSVGGLRDEAEIRGHRRTYVGAMPGTVVQHIRRAGVRNPVFQIDEIDKMGADARGDPASALLELLDPTTNDSFRDHYLDVPFDLSEVIFLVTANLVDPIPAALRDRLEVVRLAGYTHEEKRAIAVDHLVPRTRREHGLSERAVVFEREGLDALIEGYTREAGLRELERSLGAVCRKVAARVAAGDEAVVRVDAARVPALLGPPPHRAEGPSREPAVGVVTGLAWTTVGGVLLTVEAERLPGEGRLEITGRLGDVMQESARAAWSWLRAHADELGIDTARLQRSDVHLHFPDGATPKDGPSAGIAIATALASLFTGRPVRCDLALTGEVTLRGRVLPVGGLKEKLLAAHRAGLRAVLVPEDNLGDLVKLPDEVREALHVTGVRDAMECICEALLEPGPGERRLIAGRAVAARVPLQVEPRT